jgi:hypothetical protein
MRPTRSDASGKGSGGKRSGLPLSPPGCARRLYRRLRARAAALAAQGFALLRFNNGEVLRVLETIRLKLIELEAAHRGFLIACLPSIERSATIIM